MKIFQKLKERIELFLKEYKLKKLLDLNTKTFYSNPIEGFMHLEAENDKQDIYSEAMVKLKKEVKSRSEGKIDRFLSENKELTEFTKKNDLLVEAYRSVLDLKAVNYDVNNPEDLERLIDKRIEAYYELHNHIRYRELSRQMRRAERAGDDNLAAELYEQIKKLPNRRY
jgi:predicted RND superfamily exporter protein